MDILGLKQEVPQDPVGQVLRHEEYGKVALVDLGKDVSEAVRATWPATSKRSSARAARLLRSCSPAACSSNTATGSRTA